MPRMSLKSSRGVGGRDYKGRRSLRGDGDVHSLAGGGGGLTGICYTCQSGRRVDPESAL